MTYKWARDFVLELLDRYSVAGGAVKASYNNQADCLRRIPKLLDDAAIRAATGAGRIRATADIRSLQKRAAGRWVICTLPEDCWEICGVIAQEGERIGRVGRVRRMSAGALALPADEGGEMWLEYWRYPALLGEDPAEEADLDNTVEVQMALPYYAAAWLAAGEDGFLYSALMNEFENKLARVGELPELENDTVEDVYGAY